ncbi:hypothetical protein PG993_015295 [Apiospora rasikravindrae]|uniref:Uncharacterized protein n=1 Tax=Apiospora rasikravindrae TaxID=990691 RepID=A0ABR1RRC2_9PEZI
MQFSYTALFLASLAAATPMAERVAAAAAAASAGGHATFDYWKGKDCGVPSSGYHLTDRESVNECHQLEQFPRPGAVSLSEITPGCQLHLYSSTDCNVTTGGDFLAVKGECVVMDGPAEAKFGGFKLFC